MNILHDRPDEANTGGFCRERIDGVRALANIAKQAFNRIGGADVAMHDRWKVIKGQKVLSIFHQTMHGPFGHHAECCVPGKTSSASV